MLNNEQVKVNVEDPDEYKNLTKILSGSNYSWHTYENKQTRPIRVVAKKLHYSCKPERIIEDLRNMGFEIIEAVNMLKTKDKTPLSLFMLTFQNSENIKKIYEIKEILGMKVDIETLRKSKLIPQCKKCQAFGHTQRFCNREQRYVKCAVKHPSKDCSKSKQIQLKYANCGENHPANYRGCEVAKKLQTMRNEALKKRINNNMQPIKEIGFADVVQGKTFSQAVQGTNAMDNKLLNNDKMQDNNNVTSSLAKLVEKLDNLEKNFSEQGELLNGIFGRLSKLKGLSKRVATPHVRRR